MEIQSLGSQLCWESAKVISSKIYPYPIITGYTIITNHNILLSISNNLI